MTSLPKHSPSRARAILTGTLALASTFTVLADVGDPQIRTDHPWYPGELACSTFERLFKTQAEQYQRMTGKAPQTEEEKVLASWAWRNTHFAHGEEGAENLWGTGFTKGDLRTREYWTGLFAHGFGLCGTTHSQWTAELQHLLGHGRGRGVGVAGHNSFEVFLRGGAYGDGRWALLDHDISTVIFDDKGERLLSIPEIQSDLKQLATRDHQPTRQRGWLVCGLHPNDGSVYSDYNTAEYLAGYAGAPPIVNLRRGETLRRYFEPGLEDGKTFVFWGRNYRADGIPGPERSLSWVNNPDAMYRSTSGATYKKGQVRFANAAYTYRPDFASGAYREGIVEETPQHVTFEFQSPYIIGATPANDGPYGIYDPGARNGLIVDGKATCEVAISLDHGRTWKSCGPLRPVLDLTDHVKGSRHYWIRFAAGAKDLAASALTIRTNCQANVAVLPRLKENGSTVEYAASNRGIISAGPEIETARTHAVDGSFGSPTVTLRVDAPRKSPILSIHTAAQWASGNPPDRKAAYTIEYSTDEGTTWKPIVSDWKYPQHGSDPADYWSQSFCYGTTDLRESNNVQSVLIKFRNNSRRNILRACADVIYRTPTADPLQVTYDWMEGTTPKRESHVFSEKTPAPWKLPTGQRVQTRWVEFTPAPSR